MKINSYKELIAYKKSYDLAKIIYKLTQEFPKEEMYGLTNQLRRAVISIPSNIAEGYMRGSKEYVQFLKVALGSCAELETQLSLCSDIGYLKVDDFDKAFNLLQEVMRLLHTYINRLSNR